MEGKSLEVRQVDRTHPPAQLLPAFVTQAYGWGLEDGQAGQRSQGWMFWTLGDPRQQEYADGYQAGQAQHSHVLFTLGGPTQ